MIRYLERNLSTFLKARFLPMVFDFKRLSQNYVFLMFQVFLNVIPNDPETLRKLASIAFKTAAAAIIEV